MTDSADSTFAPNAPTRKTTAHAPTAAASVPPSDSERSDMAFNNDRRARLAAAKCLWLQSRSAEDAKAAGFERLAEPAHRDEAVAAYNEALRRLHLPTASGLKDVRREVHEAAHVLNVNYGAQAPAPLR